MAQTSNSCLKILWESHLSPPDIPAISFASSQMVGMPVCTYVASAAMLDAYGDYTETISRAAVQVSITFPELTKSRPDR